MFNLAFFWLEIKNLFIRDYNKRIL